MATIKFTNYADYVDNSWNYTNTDNTWYLLGGNDVLYGTNGRDTVYAGTGDDYVRGSDGDDTIRGEAGNDHIYGDNGFDVLSGAEGNDYVTGQGDGQHDVVFGGFGNDILRGDCDRFNAGTGNDYVGVTFWNGSERADVTLGTGKDKLNLDLHEYDWSGYNTNSIIVRDFKAEDKLTMSTYNQNEYLETGQVLDRLDVNNDGWLGAKDAAEDHDGDSYSVHIGSNYLELSMNDTSVIFQGMTKASFDFLS